MGEGWWIASDGKWYPGNTHPDALARGPAAGYDDVAPADGWWQASDGNWYAPELHPDNIATITLSRRASPLLPGAVSRSHGGPADFAPSRYGGVALDSVGSPLPGSGPALAINGTATRVNGSRGSAHLLLEAGGSAPMRRRDNPSRERDDGLGDAGEEGWRALERRRGPADRRAPIPDRRARAAARGEPPGQQRQPATSRSLQQAKGDLDLEPSLLLGEWVPPTPSRPAGRPQPSTPPRPVVPSNRRSPAPPRGPHPAPRLNGARYQSVALPGRIPSQDGFEEWLRTFSPGQPPRTARQGPTPQPPRTARQGPTPQRLMGVADVLNGARMPAGGPTSILPRISSREADFFVVKPSRKKARATRSPAGTKLSGALFALAMVLVLAAVGIAVIYIHAHPH